MVSPRFGICFLEEGDQRGRLGDSSLYRRSASQSIGESGNLTVRVNPNAEQTLAPHDERHAARSRRAIGLSERVLDQWNENCGVGGVGFY